MNFKWTDPESRTGVNLRQTVLVWTIEDLSGLLQFNNRKMFFPSEE